MNLWEKLLLRVGYYTCTWNKPILLYIYIYIHFVLPFPWFRFTHNIQTLKNILSTDGTAQKKYGPTTKKDLSVSTKGTKGFVI